MKQVCTCILFVCLIAATFSNCLLIFSFDVNQEYISKQLCENKTNTAMHCNGHCYLSRQLAKEEKPSSPLNSKGVEKFEVQIFILNPSFSVNAPGKNKTRFITLQQVFTSQEYLQNNFHPPQA